MLTACPRFGLRCLEGALVHALEISHLVDAVFSIPAFRSHIWTAAKTICLSGSSHTRHISPLVPAVLPHSAHSTFKSGPSFHSNFLLRSFPFQRPAVLRVCAHSSTMRTGFPASDPTSTLISSKRTLATWTWSDYRPLQAESTSPPPHTPPQVSLPVPHSFSFPCYVPSSNIRL